MESYTRKDVRCPRLELRLGPPGEDLNMSRERNHDSVSSIAYFPNNPPWPSFIHGEELKSAEKNKDTATTQKRSAPASVVGWPPIRSFRKNIANGSSSSKPASESPDATIKNTPKQSENCKKTLFVKINMDGIPIGRKVDLKAYDSYEKLALAVNELFRGLLAAQSDCCGGIKDNDDGSKGIGGLLDGSGKYTLVYEDNEGDRMLVGDVPWIMFVSTVKRLRVLKSSDLPMLSREGKHGNGKS